MKHFRPILLLVLAVLCCNINTYAQSPWTIGVGYSGVDFAPPAKESSKFANWGHGGYLNVTRGIIPSVDLSASASFVELPNLGEIFPGREATVGSFMLDLGGRYRFANGSILSEDSRFDPYILGNVGSNWIDNDAYLFINGGLGINYWLDEGVAINIQSAYEHPFEYDAYLHHRIGFRFKLQEPSDADGDGIPDSKDKCPNEKGVKEFDGCPDSDGDGIVDSEDACPNEKGLAAFKGCPDTDGDGIMDKDDKCPEAKGTAEFNGCPDTDGDGIGDADDKCPEVKGTAALNGCPDSDGDGIGDEDDACPNEKGSAALNGCPDKDGDGVADKDDKCPNEKGTKANNGCPEEEDEEEIEKELEVASKAIQFESGRDVIKRESYKELDVILEVLNRNPKASFRIEGHTDSVGNAAANKALSQKRAEAVKKYFTDKGVAANRLSAKGFGSEKPIAPNTTREGQAKNRRVEIHLQK